MQFTAFFETFFASLRLFVSVTPANVTHSRTSGFYPQFVGRGGSSGLRICTRERDAVDSRRRDELSRDRRLAWLAENIPAGVFFGGLTSIADRFGLRRTTDERK